MKLDISLTLLGIILMAILLVKPLSAGTAMICHPDGTCELVIIQSE